MKTLKFLGKVALPVTKEQSGDGFDRPYNTIPRGLHIEGALKEAAELLETDWLKWPAELRTEYGKLDDEHGGVMFIAFLIRKTLGEVEKNGQEKGT